MKPTKLAILIQGFFQKHLPEERGLSPNTILSYRDAAKDFLLYVCRSKRTTALKLEAKWLTAEVLLAYLNWLEKSRGLSIRTRNQRLAALKTLLAYLGANDLSNLAIYQRTSMIEAKRRPHRAIDYLTDHEMKVLLAVAAKADHRHRLLLGLLYNTGGRVQEICDLRFSDVVFGPPPSVYLTGKGNKRRQVPIWPATADLLQEELARRGSESGLEENVVVTARGKPMSRFGARHVIKALVREAEKECASLKRKTVSPHMLRHTTAMHLLQSGVDLSVIRIWLGHVSVNTTHAYVEIDVEMKREALRRSKKLKPGIDLKKVLKKHEDVITWLESL